MKPVVRQSNKKAAFTIIELLTVMSIIIILIGLLVPALNMVKRFARNVMQKNQFHAIEVQMEAFNAEWEAYPPSSLIGGAGGLYCGANRLSEAMLGQDLLGFHPDSKFIPGDQAYNLTLNPDLSSRKLYLPPGSANAYRLKDIYPNPAPFAEMSFVLCDVYTNVTQTGTGKLIGMPVLYYRANPSNTGHSVAEVVANESIYTYLDNHLLASLGMPWEAPPPAGPEHPLHENPEIFYEMTRNNKIDLDLDGVGDRPYRGDSYILLSAGWDGKYGTDDDMLNFKR